jgi:hypothetical protein
MCFSVSFQVIWGVFFAQRRAEQLVSRCTKLGDLENKDGLLH